MCRLAVALVLTLIAISAFADDPKPGDAVTAKPNVAPKAADGDAPLAKGFPTSTEPGKIEVKRYPAYRSAVAKAENATISSGDLMFFSLFGHIQRNKIEMTAPVISTFSTPRMIETPGATGEVTMEFVYRDPVEGKVGPDGKAVEVKDHPAEDFVCLGFQGRMTDQAMRDGTARVRAWLDEHKAEWVANGPARRIGYHGPMTPAAQRLWEIQIPVKKAQP